MTRLQGEIARRRTFAIISHPDAGKTTLTEKLLLFGGAIQMSGAVKARGKVRRSRSDWMKVEAERGISVASSVMTYDYGDCTFNLLDTPGHEDFSEDTYRTLSAVDSAVMVIDAARGIETQTRKLFEVCRLRDVPIITFINKLDREGRDPFELLDEIEQSLALDVTPASWPIGMGRNFHGCYDVLGDRLVLMKKGNATGALEEDRGSAAQCDGVDDPRLDTLLPGDAATELREQLTMARGLCPPLDIEAYREGSLSPVFFGSAINNFGVAELLDGLVRLAPPPGGRETGARQVTPDEDKVSGFVFKIQANMDPKHRDRVAFFRVTSGHFKRGMKLFAVRSGKSINLHNPMMFLAQDRETAEDAWPGDIIGIPNHGNLRIGDTLTEGEQIQFAGVPSFAPELLMAVNAADPMRVKHLGRALTQLAEEGVARVFRTRLGSNWVVGVLGALQFEVMADRIRTEYDVPVRFSPVAIHTARWLEADDAHALKKFIDKNSAAIADDHDGTPVFLARNAWHLENAAKEAPDIRFLTTLESTPELAEA
ncbi:MAG: peptide chain release factor 3 [Alphaproteobacteria bacterium]|nr:peptide chain release factor 3 [Alphaproteobacteria bacterium]